ncbi:MmpS family transport accessory protein [Streptomyces sp. SP18CS02]|uniref:MmpS family transport accessory protein n=1 Tax=Streptomyces sp. SP18CS02 TaxID=3002531 RepID=UPI002E7A237C|nr:MmpS family transport accessory protein [Streptomyces sp. SP18CS02]MEE1756110.1 MmpS family transport accessory protein [Streptomyces sp. SP18CS02]
MNRISRSAFSVLIAGGLALGLGACSEVAEEATKRVDKAVNEEYQVTYEVTGKGVDAISFNAGGGDVTNPKLETVENPTLPWKKTVTLRGLEAPVVTPVAVDIQGAEAGCRITYDGKVIKEASGAGMAAATGCVAESPLVG